MTEWIDGNDNHVRVVTRTSVLVLAFRACCFYMMVKMLTDAAPSANCHDYHYRVVTRTLVPVLCLPACCFNVYVEVLRAFSDTISPTVSGSSLMLVKGGVLPTGDVVLPTTATFSPTLCGSSLLIAKGGVLAAGDVDDATCSQLPTTTTNFPILSGASLQFAKGGVLAAGDEDAATCSQLPTTTTYLTGPPRGRNLPGPYPPSTVRRTHGTARVLKLQMDNNEPVAALVPFLQLLLPLPAAFQCCRVQPTPTLPRAAKQRLQQQHVLQLR